MKRNSQQKNRNFAQLSDLGIALLLMIFSSGALMSCSSSQKSVIENASPLTRTKHLFVALDGVPLSTVQRLHARGVFHSDFKEPIPLVSPFPSVTPTGFTALLGAHPTSGYEDEFFDIKTQSVKGGFLYYLTEGKEKEQAGDNLGFFHLKNPRVFDFFAYPFSEPSADYELENIKVNPELIRFLSSDDPREFFSAYILSTDSLTHMKGELVLERYLELLSEFLTEIKNQYGEKLHITLASDHGNLTMRKWKWFNLQKLLHDAGYRVHQKLEKPKDIAIPLWGNVGYYALYTNPNHLKALQGLIASQNAVDLVSVKAGKSVVVARKLKAAELAKASITKVGDHFKYECLNGDPLEIGKCNVSASRDEWLKNTWQKDLPHAVVRLWDAHSKAIAKSPAPLLVSLKDGYYGGQIQMARMGHSISSHGNIRAGGSLTFLMSTVSSPQTEVLSMESVPDFIRDDYELAFRPAYNIDHILHAKRRLHHQDSHSSVDGQEPVSHKH